MKVRWTTPALKNLEEISDYIARDNRSAADRLVRRVFDQVEVLAAHPHLGRAGRIEGTRELVIADSPYIVAYLAEDDRIEILTVVHGARRWPDRIA